MKTLKIFATALAIAISSSAFADDELPERLEMNYALKIYIDAMTAGRVEPLAEVLDVNARFTSARGRQILTHNRNQVLKLMKTLDNVTQNCETSYEVVESTDKASVVKVTMKYEKFSKIEYLMLANTGKGWKITSVCTSFV